MEGALAHIWVPEVFSFLENLGWIVIYKANDLHLYRRGQQFIKYTWNDNCIFFRIVDEEFKSDSYSASGFNLKSEKRTKYEVRKFLMMLGYEPGEPGDEYDAIYKCLAPSIFCAE